MFTVHLRLGLASFVCSSVFHTYVPCALLSGEYLLETWQLFSRSWWRVFSFYQTWRISWLAEKISACQAGFCSMDVGS